MYFSQRVYRHQERLLQQHADRPGSDGRRGGGATGHGSDMSLPRWRDEGKRWRDVPDLFGFAAEYYLRPRSIPPFPSSFLLSCGLLDDLPAGLFILLKRNSLLCKGVLCVIFKQHDCICAFFLEVGPITRHRVGVRHSHLVGLRSQIICRLFPSAS